MPHPTKCPICNKASEEKYQPFCSKRCADVDLGKWLNSSYSIPVIEDEELENPSDDGNESVDQ